MPPANTPTLYTPRLILRRFTPDDLDALLALFGDEQVNAFLPWFPLRTRQEAAAFYEERFGQYYARPCAYRYAVCLRETDRPVGYIHADMDEAHDFGYALERAHWGQGLITEAGRALIARLREDGLPFITATHDVNNPRSGAVMRRLGMTYRYSHEEQWQPKDVRVTFRMYQLNLGEDGAPVFRGYWDRYAVHFVEPGL